MKLTYNNARQAESWGIEMAKEYLHSNGMTSLPLLHTSSSIDSQLEAIGDAFGEAGWHDFIEIDIGLVSQAAGWTKNGYIASKEFKSHLKGIYDSEAKAKSHELNFLLPMQNSTARPSIRAIQLYRENTGNYRGNLYDARKVWPGFIPSANDFEKNITLPLLDNNASQLSKVAYVLGVLYSKSSVNNMRGTQFPFPNRVTTTTSSHDYSFFKEDVAPLLENIFNLDDVFVAREIKQKSSRLVSAIRETVTFPIINIDSYAIATWMSQDLGAPVAKKQEFTDFPLAYFNKDQQRDFLRGYLRASARFNGKQFRMFDSRAGRLPAVRKLMTKFTKALIKISKNGRSANPQSKVLTVTRADAMKLMDDLSIGLYNLRPVSKRPTVKK